VGKLVLNRLAIADGSGFTVAGGVYNDRGSTLEVNGVTFSGNSVNFFGGAIYNRGGTLRVNGSTFSGNSGLGAGIHNELGTVEINDSTFSDNRGVSQGGGIYNSGAMTVNGSTFSGNRADYGGGIATGGGDLTVSNSTFSGNSVNVQGGGILVSGGTVEVGNSTFSGNGASGGGGGIYNSGSPVTLLNTIVAASTTGGNCSGPVTDGGHNLEDGASCGFSATTSRSSMDPLFAGGLADNGGPTGTIALRPNSPAVDDIPRGEGGCGAVTEDQRGVARPQGPPIEDTTHSRPGPFRNNSSKHAAHERDPRDPLRRGSPPQRPARLGTYVRARLLLAVRLPPTTHDYYVPRLRVPRQVLAEDPSTKGRASLALWLVSAVAERPVGAAG
jgi:hypothetical protein